MTLSQTDRRAPRGLNANLLTNALKRIPANGSRAGQGTVM